MNFLAPVLALVAGAVVSLQIGSNTKLKEALEHPLPAIILSSTLGVVLLAAVMALMRQPWPAVAKIAGAPASAWLGGVFGAFYAVVSVLLARHVGAATLVALVVTGQLLCSVALDHFGVLGFDVRPLTLWRGAGCAMLLGGLLLIWKF